MTKNNVEIICEKYYSEQVFLQCRCGEEILEFVRDDSSELGVQYLIIPHLNWDKRKDELATFCFANKGEFSDFIERLKNKDEPLCIFIDKYLTYKNKHPGSIALIYDKDEDCFLLRKFGKVNEKTFMPKNLSWEVVMNDYTTKKLVSILENWG